MFKSFGVQVIEHFTGPHPSANSCPMLQIRRSEDSVIHIFGHLCPKLERTVRKTSRIAEKRRFNRLGLFVPEPGLAGLLDEGIKFHPLDHSQFLANYQMKNTMAFPHSNARH